MSLMTAKKSGCSWDLDCKSSFFDEQEVAEEPLPVRKNDPESLCSLSLEMELDVVERLQYYGRCTLHTRLHIVCQCH